MPDVISLLKDDHRTVEGLFEKFESSGDVMVALQICEELTIHAVVEEELVYPVLATKVGTGYAQEARQEHQEAKELIAQIEYAIRDGEDPTPIVEQLRQGIEHHVEEEETELFPLLQQRVGNVLAQMGNDLVERKQQLQAVAEENRGQQPPSMVGHKPSVG